MTPGKSYVAFSFLICKTWWSKHALTLCLEEKGPSRLSDCCFIVLFLLRLLRAAETHPALKQLLFLPHIPTQDCVADLKGTLLVDLQLLLSNICDCGSGDSVSRDHEKLNFQSC